MGRFFITFLVWAICYATCKAQTSKPDTIYAEYVQEEIQLDGKPDEAVWKRAVHINNFTQRELNIGEPATERTEVAILYTAKTLYIGFWGYDRNPQKIIAREMKRDFDWGGEDNFEVLSELLGYSVEQIADLAVAEVLE